MSTSNTINSIITSTSELCVLRNDIIDKLILCGDSDGALLYIYIARKSNSFNEKNAIADLKFTPERFEKAMFTLTNLTIATTQPLVLPSKPLDAPKYNMRELKSSRSSDEKFSTICNTAESIFGRTLTESHLRSLYTVYDHVKLPAEVIIELLIYLKQEKEVVRRSDIEREAHTWADMGLFTQQEATAYLTKRQLEKPLIKAMQEALGLAGREPTVTEYSYYSEFVAKGFSHEAVALAAQRSEKQLKKFSWKYIRGIINRWDDMGAHTLTEILAIDPERTPTKNSYEKPAPAPSKPTDDTVLEAWEKDWLEQLKQQRKDT